MIRILESVDFDTKCTSGNCTQCQFLEIPKTEGNCELNEMHPVKIAICKS